MVRSIFYLLVSGLIWVGEGFLFSRLLGFKPAVIAAVAAMYVALFAVAVAVFMRSARRPRLDRSDVAEWRLLSAAPMLAVIVGSFVSLPLLLLVAVVNSRL